jgi:hypothetical protein
MRRAWLDVLKGQVLVVGRAILDGFAQLLRGSVRRWVYVMSQMGHESSALALEVYARMMQRQRDTGARMDALVRGVDWARMGTSEPNAAADASAGESVADAASAVLQGLQ